MQDTKLWNPTDIELLAFRSLVLAAWAELQAGRIAQERRAVA